MIRHVINIATHRDDVIAHLLCLVAIVAITLMPHIAVASPITFSFEGNVRFVDDLLTGTFSAGQTIQGSYTFESSTVDAVPDPSIGAYSSAITALSFSIGSYMGQLASVPTYNDIGLNDDDLIDVYGVLATVDGPAVAGYPLTRFAIVLQDATGTALDAGVDLPLTPPDLNDFDFPGGTTFQLEFEGAGPEPAFANTPTPPGYVRGSLTSLSLSSPSSVPEPGTLALFGLGLTSLGFARCRRAAA